MKPALLVALGSIVLAATIIVASSLWAGGEPKGALEPRELTWIRHYYAWTGERSCTELPSAPTDSFRRIARLARAACSGASTWPRVERMIQARLFYSRPLPKSKDALNESYVAPGLGRVAARVAQRKVEARCWSPDDWRRVNRELRTIFPQNDHWAIGYADRNGRVHLLGVLCEPLVRFFGSRYTPASNLDRAELADSLVVLAHEAEHQRDFRNSEAEVQCYAVQRVRDLVLAEGRKAAFAADIAAYAWNVSYFLGDPIYGTARCRNGGPLDLHPGRPVWP
jgi:hypothetical protein